MKRWLLSLFADLKGEPCSIGRNVRVCAWFVFFVWAGLGLVPAVIGFTWTCSRHDFNLSAALGAAGDSFAGVNSLISSLGFVAVAYGLYLDRQQRAEDEKIRLLKAEQDSKSLEEDRKHQARNAMLAALIQVRVARDNGYRDSMFWTLERREQAKKEGGVVSPNDETVDSLNRASLHNYCELERLIKHAEEMIKWESSPVPPSIYDSRDRQAEANG